MTLNSVMAVTLCYFTEFGKRVFQHITASICNGIYARWYSVVRVRCRRKKVHVRYLIVCWISCYCFCRWRRLVEWRMGRGYPLPRRLGIWGNVVKFLSGVRGAQPRLKTILVLLGAPGRLSWQYLLQILHFFSQGLRLKAKPSSTWM